MHSVEQDDEVQPWERTGRPRRRQMPLWQEMPLLLVVAFGIAVVIRAFLVQAFYIPSGSMEDTLARGDKVLVNKVVYEMRDPQRGEIVVFRGTGAWGPKLTGQPDPGLLGQLERTVGDLVGVARPGEKDYIKRVIGVPGDRVACCDDGRVTVNGVPLDESAYVLQDSPEDVPPAAGECRSRWFDEVVVPPGQLFVMGDHRRVSQDSRCQGTVPIDDVIGRAFVIVWPHARWATLSVPDTFDRLSGSMAAPAASDSRPVRSDHVAGIAVVLPLVGVLRVPAASIAVIHRRRRQRRLST